MAESSPAKSSLRAILDQLPLAEVVEPAQLERIASIATIEDYAAETTLFRPGDEADSIYVVVSGRVSLIMQAPGGEATIVGSRSRGDLFGWAALRVDCVRGTSARASKATRCLRCSGAALRELCELDHELGYRVMSHAFDVVCGNLFDCRTRLLDIYGQGQPT